MQTLYPNHYSIRHACRQDYAAFYEDELKFRRAMRYPPAVALDQRRRQGADAPWRDGGRRRRSPRRCARPAWGRGRVLGPAPAPLGGLKGEHRAQLFIKGTHRTAMRKALLTRAGGDGRS